MHYLSQVQCSILPTHSDVYLKPISFHSSTIFLTSSPVLLEMDDNVICGVRPTQSLYTHSVDITAQN